MAAHPTPLPHKSPYTKNNHQKYFISIDMKSANFQSLRLTDPELVLNTSTWEELVGKFTTYELFGKCKAFRQKVLSYLNQKKQQKIWESIMLFVYYRLCKHSVCSPTDFYAHVSDELIILVDSLDKLQVLSLAIHRYLNEQLPELSNCVRVEPFKLVRLGSTTYFVKEVYSALLTQGTTDTFLHFQVNEKLPLMSDP
jgi:hypothetical protein